MLNRILENVLSFTLWYALWNLSDAVFKPLLKLLH
jgi:hypothetical protein